MHFVTTKSRRTGSPLLVALLTLLAAPCDAGAPEWSARVIERLSRIEPSAPASADASQVLRAHAIGEGLPAGDAAAILARLLPAGASARPSEDGRTLLVIAPASTQEGIAELLRIARQAPPAGAPEASLPPEVAQALARMARDTPAALEAIDSLRSELNGRMDALAAGGGGLPVPSARQAAAAAAGAAGIAGVSIVWIRRRPARPAPSAAPPALLPVAGEVEKALLPETRRQADDIKLALRELGQHLQLALAAREEAQAGLQDRVLALENGSRASGEENRAALDAAARTLEGTADRLTRENDRVQALAGELRGTLTELDRARDRLRQTEAALEERDRALGLRNQDLDRERAKLAELGRILVLDTECPAARPEGAPRVPGRDRPPPAREAPAQARAGFTLIPRTA